MKRAVEDDDDADDIADIMAKVFADEDDDSDDGIDDIMDNLFAIDDIMDNLFASDDIPNDADIMKPPLLEETRRCNNPYHYSAGSPYDDDAVPVSLFRAIADDPHSHLTKLCYHCKETGRMKAKKHRAKKRRNTPIGPNQRLCTRCLKAVDIGNMAMRLGEETADSCIACNAGVARRYAKNAAERHETKIERIFEAGCSCERCKVIILKPLEAGSTIIRQLHAVNGYVTYEGVTLPVREFLRQHKDDLETRTLEADHLPRDELEARYPGATYVPKVRSAMHGGSRRYKREFKKCQQLCPLCHIIVTIQRGQAGGASHHRETSVCRCRKTSYRRMPTVWLLEF